MAAGQQSSITTVREGGGGRGRGKRGRDIYIYTWGDAL